MSVSVDRFRRGLQLFRKRKALSREEQILNQSLGGATIGVRMPEENFEYEKMGAKFVYITSAI